MVERYDYYCTPDEYDDGDYVSYDDYKALKDAADELAKYYDEGIASLTQTGCDVSLSADMGRALDEYIKATK